MQPLAKFLSSSYPETSNIVWHLLANRTVQRNKTSCSVASLCVAFNGLISQLNSGVVDKVLSEPGVLDMLAATDLRRNLSEGTGGATLEQISVMATETITGLGGLSLSATAYHMEEPNGAFLKKFSEDLLNSGQHGNSVIVVNYHQGVLRENEQTHGHFAPAAPLGSAVDPVCVVDPSFEGMPFVVSIERLVKAMATEDKTSGRKRGYLKIALDSA